MKTIKLFCLFLSCSRCLKILSQVNPSFANSLNSPLVIPPTPVIPLSPASQVSPSSSPSKIDLDGAIISSPSKIEGDTGGV